MDYLYLLKIATGVATVVIAGANLYYIWKFRESVNAERRSTQGALLFDMTRTFFYQEPHKEITRRLEEDISLEETLSADKPPISEEQLDDHIGFFDTLGAFVKAKVIDINLAWEVFSHYVESTYESAEIAQYIRQQRHNDSTLFENFIWLYEQMNSITKTKHAQKK